MYATWCVLYVYMNENNKAISKNWIRAYFSFWKNVLFLKKYILFSRYKCKKKEKQK